jgi:plasmid stabilization system protein ParE
MAVELIIAPEVEQDLAAAYAWYEARRAGLGEEFLSCVEACIAAICRIPEMYAAVHEQYRRRFVRRFPYAVFYEHTAGTVTVYCIFHTARDPDKWRQRLP